MVFFYKVKLYSEEGSREWGGFMFEDCMASVAGELEEGFGDDLEEITSIVPYEDEYILTTGEEADLMRKIFEKNLV